MLKDYTAVSNWMNENFLTINYQALISEALDLIMQVELSELPVIKDNKVIGVFNFKYYLHALSNEEIAINDRVTNWMTQTFSFTSDRALMNQIETTPTYVLNEGKELIGVIYKKIQKNFIHYYFNENLKLKEQIGRASCRKRIK